MLGYKQTTSRSHDFNITRGVFVQQDDVYVQDNFCSLMCLLLAAAFFKDTLMPFHSNAWYVLTFLCRRTKKW